MHKLDIIDKTDYGGYNAAAIRRISNAHLLLLSSNECSLQQPEPEDPSEINLLLSANLQSSDDKKG